jgi:hypothetical protein
VTVLVATPAAGAHSTKVRVSVVPRSSFADQPVHIRVAGSHARSSAEIRLRVRDDAGKLWHASASYRADPRGVIDVDRAEARSGSYAGRWGMGLLASLTTQTRSAYRFRWHGADSQPFRIDVRVRGRRVASRTFRRAMPGAVAEQPVSIGDAGFLGTYYARAGISARAPGILFLGGSEGGLPFPPLAELLAARGYPTLGVAYFREPGLPQTLENIPLEYFQRALVWLRAQPQVESEPDRRARRLLWQPGCTAAGSRLPEPRQRRRCLGSQQRCDLRAPVLLRAGVDIRGAARPVHQGVQRSVSE